MTALSRVLLLRTPLPSFCGSVCSLQAARTHWLLYSHVTLAAGSVEVACGIFEFLGNCILNDWKETQQSAASSSGQVRAGQV